MGKARAQIFGPYIKFQGYHSEPRHLLSKNHPKPWGNSDRFLERTIVEQNGESTPRKVPKLSILGREVNLSRWCERCREGELE